MISPEIVAWAAIAGLAAHVIAVTTYLQNRAKSRADIENTARLALKRAEDTAEKLAVLTASFSLHKEQMARDYINRESMREVEARLTLAMSQMEGRLTTAIEHQGERIDHAFAGRVRGPG